MITKNLELNIDGITLKAILDLPDDYEGKKLPLLLILHGFTGWKEEVHIEAVAKAAVEEGYAAFRYDQYGHGASGGEFKDHDIMIWLHQAMNVINIVSKYDFVKEVVVAGHSQGGLNTILVGGMLNDLVKAIIPMSPAVNIVYAAREDIFFGMNLKGKELPEYFTFGNRSLGSNYHRVAKMISIETAIKNFEKPVLLIHGTKDEAVPYDYSVELNKQFKNSKLITIPDDNHGYSLHLDMVVESVKEFLKEIK